MKVINASIPREDRAEVQAALGALNAILPAPDLHQMNVLVAFNAGTAVYKLDGGSLARVLAKLAELVSHQLPSPTSGSLPSIAPSVKSACDFFGVPLDYTPPLVGDVEGQGIDR